MTVRSRGGDKAGSIRLSINAAGRERAHARRSRSETSQSPRQARQPLQRGPPGSLNWQGHSRADERWPGRGRARRTEQPGHGRFPRQTADHFRASSWVWWRSRSPPPPDTSLRLLLSDAAGGFLTWSGALPFSCDAPGPPWRMVDGFFDDVDMDPRFIGPADNPDGSC